MIFTQDRALVLYKTSFKDTHEIVTLFGREQGKMSAFLYGAKSLKSKYRGTVETLHHIDVRYTEKDQRVTITEAKKIDGFIHLSTELALVSHAFRLLEMVHKLLPLGAAFPELFDTLLLALHAVNVSYKPHFAVLVCMGVFLDRLGVLPDFSTCTQCSIKLSEQPGYYHPSESTLRCTSCARGHLAMEIPFSTVKLLAFLQRSGFQEVMKVKPDDRLLHTVEEVLLLAFEQYTETSLRSSLLVA